LYSRLVCPRFEFAVHMAAQQGGAEASHAVDSVAAAWQDAARLEFGPEDFATQQVTEVIPGIAWVVTGVLTPEECKEWIGVGEDYGFEAAPAYSLRSAKRTRQFHNDDMGPLALSRLPAELIQAVEATGMGTRVMGIHPNWRLVRYDVGDGFAAHVDQQDELSRKTERGESERWRSTHTLLVSLSDCSENTGGATRFFPKGTCEETVDLRMPQGSALVFQQKGVLHSGMPVTSGTKHIAQAGLLRALPSTGRVERPHVFKWGLGLGYQDVNEAELLERQGQRTRDERRIFQATLRSGR